MNKLTKYIVVTVVALCSLNGAWAQTWNTLPAPTSANDYRLNTGYYRMNKNITLSGAYRYKIAKGETIVIDLAGYTFNCNGKSIALFSLEGGTLTIMDSSTNKTGMIRGSRKTCFYIAPSSGQSATVNIEGGTIYDCQPSDGEGGAVEINARGTLNLKGGVIRGCHASQGAGVYVNGGTFNMTGGEISENEIFSLNDSANSSWTYPTGENLPAGIDSSKQYDGASNRQNNQYEYKGGGVYVEAGTFNMSGGTISKNVAINGGGVYVTSGAKFTLTGGTIKDNIASSKSFKHGNGGGVYLSNGATFTIEGTSASVIEVSGNRVSRYGGGIYVQGDSSNSKEIKVNVKYANLHDNYASSGGGIAQEVGTKNTMTLTNCIIENNSAKVVSSDTQYYGGGGVYLSSGTLTINNSASYKILDNKSVQNGGAIYMGGGTLSYTKGTITGNIAQTSGGGIYIRKGTFVVTNSATINDNQAVGTSGGGVYLYDDGSAFTVNEGATVKVGSSSKPNTANDNGGGVLLRKGTATINGTIEIMGNQAITKAGGGLYLGEGAVLTVGSNGVINVGGDAQAAGNTAGTKGGGIYLNSGTITINGTADLQNNTANTYGGGICVDAGSITVGGSTNIKSNKATNNSGGGIYCKGNITFNGASVLSSNSAAVDGGAICLEDGTFTVGSSGSLQLGGDAEIDGNTATNGKGGGVYCKGQFTANGRTTYKYNIAQYGGAVYVDGNTYTSGKSADATISYNTATQSGGAIYVAGGSCNIQGQSTISNNRANGNTDGVGEGGALYVQGSVTLAKNTISNNSANTIGGAIYVTGANSGFTATGESTITENTASLNGGALYIGGGDVSLKTSTITKNKALGSGEYGNGGAIYLIGKLKLLDGSVVMNDNEANNNGGAAYVLGTIEQTNGSIKCENNKAVVGNGGVFYVDGSANASSSNTVKLLTTTMQNNEAAKDGGAFYVQGGNISLGMSTLNQNKAINGGAIALFGGSFGFGDGSIVSNNKATGNGGGLYVVNNSTGNDYKTISCDGGSLTNNTAVGNGGGLYVSGKIKFNFAESLTADITGNNALNGGGIYIADNTDMTFGNGLIVGNSAVVPATKSSSAAGTGGGIYLAGGTLSFAAKKNGVLSFENIESLGIYGNSAGYEAADIYSSGSSTTLNLPNVSGMNLTGFDVPGSTLYWVKDFSDDNEEYLGRYESALLNLNINIEEMILGFNDNEKTKTIQDRMCLDLGYDLVYVGLEAVNLVTNGIADKSVVHMYYERDNENKLYRTSVIKGANSVTKVGLPTGQWLFEIEDFSESHNVQVTFKNENILQSDSNFTLPIELTRNTIKDANGNVCNVVFEFVENSDGDNDDGNNYVPIHATASIVNKMKW